MPAMAIALGAPVPLAAVEIGTKVKWRTRHLMIDSYTRTTDEQGLFKDALANWLDENTILAIADHDAGTLAVVGAVEVLDSTVASARVVDRAEAVTYEVLLNARLEYAVSVDRGPPPRPSFGCCGATSTCRPVNRAAHNQASPHVRRFCRSTTSAYASS